MFDQEAHGFCSEFYVVEQTIEVVVRKDDETKSIRIDALRDERTGRYKTKAYVLEDVTVQPTYPRTGSEFDSKPENVRVWIGYDLPWTDRETAEDALRQALGFLSERYGQTLSTQ